jgi:hypothetical protein
MRRRTIASLVACALAFAQFRAASGQDADGQSAFAGVRGAWAGMTYPQLVNYAVVVSVTIGAKTRAARYTGQVLPISGDFRVRKFSDEEDRNPGVPRGTNVKYSVSIDTSSHHMPGSSGPAAGSSIEVGGAVSRASTTDVFAIPEISPLYSFGIRACAPRRVHRPSDDDSALKTIGTVVTTDSRYRVTIVGTETVNGFPATHLALVPLIDAHRDRLRDLWFDPASDVLVQARVLGNFTGAGNDDVPWLVRFTTMGGALYIASEESEAPVRRGGVLFDRVALVFDGVSEGHGSAQLAFALPNDYGALNTIAEPPEAFGKNARCS